MLILTQNERMMFGGILRCSDAAVHLVFSLFDQGIARLSNSSSILNLSVSKLSVFIADILYPTPIASSGDQMPFIDCWPVFARPIKGAVFHFGRIDQ